MSAVLTSHPECAWHAAEEDMEDCVVTGANPKNGAVGVDLMGGCFSYINPGGDGYQSACMRYTHFFMNGDWWLIELEQERRIL